MRQTPILHTALTLASLSVLHAADALKSKTTYSEAYGATKNTVVPKTAITVGPKETWQAEKVSIWQAGMHDNPLGQRLTALMISKRLADSAVPMSLLADHPNVQFNYYRGGLGSCAVEMH